MKRLWKKIVGWFSKEEVLELVVEEVPELVVEEVPELVVEEKPTHCTGHTRFKKSCSLCQAIIK
jgi:hypothetical protein